MTETRIAWVNTRSQMPELFHTVKEALDEMRNRICQPGDSDSFVVERAHKVGISLAIVEVTVKVKLILGPVPPAQLGPG